MFADKRRAAIERTQALLERQASGTVAMKQSCLSVEQNTVPTRGLALLLFQAALPPRPFVLVGFAFVLGTTAASLLACFVSAHLLPLFFLAGFVAPFAYVEGRVRARALDFAADYPTVLMATASSIKAGMTPYAALDRSVRLLPRKSLVRHEVSVLLRSLEKGLSRQEAVRRFGASIRSEDLDLFRSAFLLVVENGGRFAPTLGRLACVSRDRSTLIRAAQVTTANMRMTANFLLAVAPFIVGMVSLRSEDFWDTFVNHPVANSIGSAGIVIIAASYMILRRMSSFKP